MVFGVCLWWKLKRAKNSALNHSRVLDHIQTKSGIVAKNTSPPPPNEKLEQNELLEKTATARHIIFQHVTCITQGNHVHNYCKYLHSQHCFSALGIGVLSPENICVFRPL